MASATKSKSTKGLLPPLPPRPPPEQVSSAGDVTSVRPEILSDNKRSITEPTTPHAARASLRMSMNKSLLTQQEQEFLEHLLIDGNEDELLTADEALQTNDLFAVKEETTPTSRSHELNQSAAQAWLAGDTSNTTASTFPATPQRSGWKESSRDESFGSFTSTAPTDVALDGLMMNLEQDIIRACGSGSVASDRLGSERRLERLEARRQESKTNRIWHAHETGLAVTHSASRRSIRVAGSAAANLPVPSKGNSSASNSHSRTKAAAIFRRTVSAVSAAIALERNVSYRTADSSQTSSSTLMLVRQHKAGPSAGSMPVPQNLRQRSVSVSSGTANNSTLMAINAVANDKRARYLMNDNKSDNFRRRPVVPLGPTDASSRRSMLPPSLRGVSEKPALRRLTSDSSRKSVTFELPEPPLPMAKSAQGGPEGSRPATPATDASLSEWIGGSSGGLPPPIPAGQPNSRTLSDQSGMFSLGSIPSIHKAQPLRSESVASSVGPNEFPPPLRHAHPIRSDSVASSVAPQLGAPATEGALTSPPASRHAHPLRSDSMNSRVSSLYDMDELDGRDPSEAGATAREEKKTSEGEGPWVATSVPRKVEIVSPRKDGAQPGLAESTLLLQHTKDESKLFANHPRPDHAIFDDYSTVHKTDSSSVFTAGDGSLAYIPDTDDEKTTTTPDDGSSKNPMNTTVFSIDTSASGSCFRRPVLMQNADEEDGGEGIEVADFEMAAESMSPHHGHHTVLHKTSTVKSDHFDEFRDDVGEIERDEHWLSSANSYDETMSFERVSSIFRRVIRRSLSEDAAAEIFLGTANFFRENGSTVRGTLATADDDSWQMNDEDGELDYYDAWKVVEDEYENGYGGGGTLPFYILGTSANDFSSHPHVLSPPLMESLQSFFPYSKSGENFWMKYSLVRDGASMHTFLRMARGAKYSLLAIENTEGEVFGAFTSESWRKNWNYFGTGESFLWRMRHTRKEKSHSIIDQAHMESEIDVYPFTGDNSAVQLCTQDRIAVGGGTADPATLARLSDEATSPIKTHEWGFGLMIQSDLLSGTTSPCITFASPSLSKAHKDGSLFEIINMELWTLTPCIQVEEAEKLELGRLFLEKHIRK